MSSFKYSLLAAILISLIEARCNLLSNIGYIISGRSLVFSSENERELYKETGRYVAGNIAATRMQVYRQQLIVALPRYRPGVPATLAAADLLRGRRLALRAFPDWAMQRPGHCGALQSAVDIYLDRSAVLWVLDAGDPACPPKVLAYSMGQRRTLSTMHLSGLLTASSQLQYLAVDNADDGHDYVYISDGPGKALLMFNSSNSQGRRLNLPDVVSAGGTCREALYLVKLIRDGSPHLYFSYLDSQGIFSVNTKSFREHGENTLVQLEGIKSDALVFLGSDGSSGLFYRKEGDGRVFRWDVRTPFLPSAAPVRGAAGSRKATHVAAGPLSRLWVMESNMADFVNNSTVCYGDSTFISPLLP